MLHSRVTCSPEQCTHLHQPGRWPRIKLWKCPPLRARSWRPHILTSLITADNPWTHAGARQAARLRQRYLEKALHQDISYYDTTLTSGGVQAGLNEDCTAIQNALSEKVCTTAGAAHVHGSQQPVIQHRERTHPRTVHMCMPSQCGTCELRVQVGNTVHHLVTFLASLAIAFWRGWKLTLVMVALLPLIAVAGGILAKVLTWGTTRRAQAFEEANIVAAQSIANIRTVASFQAEQPIYQRFADMLDRPRRISAKLSLYNGMAGGSINAVVFLTCALPASSHTVADPTGLTRRLWRSWLQATA